MKKKKHSYLRNVGSHKKAKSDDKIKGISIETDGIIAGMTQLDDIRNALEDFKKAENLCTLMEILFRNRPTI
ncbi:hypothetical protein LDL59_13955 [Kaistella anthropi]|nr:hypothetical protein [Kaistella anthropi]